MTGSDVDILVIEPRVVDAASESVDLRGESCGLGVAIDVIVVGEATATRRSRRARRDGRAGLA